MDKLKALRRHDPWAFCAALAPENQETFQPGGQGRNSALTRPGGKKYRSLLAEGDTVVLFEEDPGLWLGGSRGNGGLRGWSALSNDPADFLARVLHGKEQDLERGGGKRTGPGNISG